MTLRARLALAIVATAVPLGAGLLWVRTRLELASLERGLREFALTHMQQGGREACEARPADFPDRLRGPGPGGPGPGGFGPGGDRRGPGSRRGRRLPPGPAARATQYWAYDAEFASANPAALPFPPALRAALEGGDETAAAFADAPDGRRVVRVASRMPWDEGPCAVVLVERTLPDRPDDAALVGALGALAGVVLLAVLLSAGPIVRRIRRLQVDVRRAAADRYRTPVEAAGGDELAGLAAAFNEAGREVRTYLEEIEAREKTLRDFVANTTHDVMIPLTVLQGHLAAIRREADAGRAVEKGRVRDALEEAHYLASLLQNLSAAAKLEATGLERNPVDLNALVERVVARHAPVARSRGVVLEHACPEVAPTTSGDVTLLEQAVSNLVHNAIRHNESGGHASVLLGARDGRFRLQVLDDGPGVDPREIARIAERHYRTDSARRREPEGRGLGLAIAADVARRHGFTLEFAAGPEGRGLAAALEGPLA